MWSRATRPRLCTLIRGLRGRVARDHITAITRRAVAPCRKWPAQPGASVFFPPKWRRSGCAHLQCGRSSAGCPAVQSAFRTPREWETPTTHSPAPPPAGARGYYPGSTLGRTRSRPGPTPPRRRPGPCKQGRELARRSARAAAGGAAEGRAEGLVVAPVAQPAGLAAASRRSRWPARSPPRAPRTLRSVASRSASSGLVAQHLAVAEVEQLQQPGDHAARRARAPARRTSSGTAPWPRTPRRARGRSCSRRPAARRPAPRRAGRRSRAAAARRPARPRRSSSRSAGLEPARVLQREVARRAARGAAPATSAQRAPSSANSVAELGLGLEQPLPLRAQQRARRLGGALGGRQVEEPLEHRVHHACRGWRPSDGGCGSRSMMRKRNSSGQVMKSPAREGDRAARSTRGARHRWPAQRLPARSTRHPSRHPAHCYPCREL